MISSLAGEVSDLCRIHYITLGSLCHFELVRHPGFVITSDSLYRALRPRLLGFSWLISALWSLSRYLGLISWIWALFIISSSLLRTCHHFGISDLIVDSSHDSGLVLSLTVLSL
ncbi:hypothetical protein K435DRAFT_247346 [Dendrothele bispora CBS 962.96]|uniref:Uncharacterized protein n=1 Tax=Dendrothele bispora (strain CBS 962.96) TaxID=1314807 RepID=A0A4S8LPU9_DENBC|nr:hypothetical protein K435DRAFT_247346 [Dendrothele bispora CBS 962.96]